jgi:hypothetical protein
MGLRVVAGRWLLDSDTTSSPPVVVVNRAFVRAYLAGDGVGARLPVGFTASVAEWEVIGVIDDVHPRVAGEPPRPEVYVSLGQTAEGLDFDEPSLVLRASGDAASLAPALRAAAGGVHPALLVEAVQTMEDRLRAGLAQPRLYAVLVGFFAALALAIASAGLFGVVSYTVARRTRELGVRAALGATPFRLVRLVLAQGLRATAAGVSIGLAAAALGSSLLSGLVYGVAPRDPLTFAVVPVVLVALAVVACAVPARRAAHVDPLRAIRDS